MELDRLCRCDHRHLAVDSADTRLEDSENPKNHQATPFSESGTQHEETALDSFERFAWPSQRCAVPALCFHALWNSGNPNLFRAVIL